MLQVRIEELPAMWVASVHAVGEAPEEEAWRRLKDWAGPRQMFEDAASHPVFGFNNPPPAPGHPAYGYELWIRVDGPEADDSAVVYKQFEGGLFAVTECRLVGDPDVVSTWRMLWDWTKTGPHRWRAAQELEKVVNPGATIEEMLLELHLPIRTARDAPNRET
jgi:AraC family transcriptional regulator